MGFEPVWQEIASTDGGELLDILRERIAPASLVLQLIGTRYGAEPPWPTSEFGRVSYTQFEALEAERIGKKVICHVLDDHFPRELATPEPPELASLQVAYRKRLVDSNRLRYERVASSADLELSIWRIRDELSALRRQADRRHRNLVRLGVVSLAGVLTVGVFTFIKLNRQEQHAVRQEEFAVRHLQEMTLVQAKVDRERNELAALRAEVAVVVAQKGTADKTQPPPIPPDIFEKAKVLVERGNTEERALGLIALKRHEEADQILQELESKPGNPIEEAFQLFTMRGDNWYQAGKPERAAEAYEKALVLKPDNVLARVNVVYALTFSERGDRGANVDRAIAIAEETLQLTRSGSIPWAKIKSGFGIGWHHLPMRDFARLFACVDRLRRLVHLVIAGVTRACVLGLATREEDSGAVPEAHGTRLSRDG